jgi:hypothetical protein
MENIYHTIRGRTTSPRTLESISKDPLSAAKPFLLNVHLAFDCAGSRKVEVAHLGWIWAGLFSCKFTCNKIPLWDVHVCFDCAGSHGLEPRRRSCRKVSFYQRAVLGFWAMFISCGRRGASGAFGGLKRGFVWQAQDIGHFFIRVARVGHSARC